MVSEEKSTRYFPFRIAIDAIRWSLLSLRSPATLRSNGMGLLNQRSSESLMIPSAANMIELGRKPISTKHNRCGIYTVPSCQHKYRIRSIVVLHVGFVTLIKESHLFWSSNVTYCERHHQLDDSVPTSPEGQSMANRNVYITAYAFCMFRWYLLRIV